MAKPNRDAQQEAGERTLRERGVAKDAGAEDLGALLGQSPETDVAIALRLGNMPTIESARLLRRLEHETTDKRVRKEAKRGLYKLGQRGVPIPAVAPAEPVRIEAPPIEGYVCPVDGNGDQLVWLVKPRPSGVMHLFAVLNDPLGLREVELHPISRKALRALRADLADKHDLRFVAADWRYCDFLIRRGMEWARRSGSRQSGDYLALRQQLTHEPPIDDQPPLILKLLDETEIAGQPEVLAKSATLLEEKEFRTWFFAPEPLRPYLDQLSRIRESPLVLDPVQQQERAGVVIERAVEELFGGEFRDSWARRLYEMAYFFWASERAEQARQAVAAAAALARSEGGGRGIPFFEDLTRASLAFYFEAALKADEERAQESLVLTPQQLREQRARR
jgi:hypothetical protein